MVEMSKYLSVLGMICATIMLTGFFTPWLGMYSAPYEMEGVRVMDYVEVTGWDLSIGRIKVTQMRESQEYLRWEYYRTIELQVESKSYPILCLIGGIIFLIGGISALKLKNKVPFLSLLIGGALSFIGGALGFLENRWIIPRAIVIEKYVIFGYYRSGLLLCTISSIICIFGCLFIWGFSRKNP
ncbi:MAG: hypothetical protein QW502_03095 [Candidatus Bathyarchaeia archaeon]